MLIQIAKEHDAYATSPAPGKLLLQAVCHGKFDTIPPAASMDE